MSDLKTVHPLAFLAEAVYTPTEEHERAVKKAKDAEQIAINKRKLAEDEAERQRILADFDQDEQARGKVAQLGDTDDFVEDPTGAIGTYKSAVPDQELTLDPDGWEPGEDELTGKDGPKEPEIPRESSIVPVVIADYVALLGKPDKDGKLPIISLSKVRRLQELIASKPEKTQSRQPTAWGYVDKTPLPKLKNLINALKQLAFYREESNYIPPKVLTNLENSMKSLQKVIATLLPKD